MSEGEKQNNKYLWKEIVLSVMFGMILAILCCPVTLQASSAKWKKACKSYDTWLAGNYFGFVAEEFDFKRENKENYKKSDRFMIVDLDKNRIPELVVTHPIAWKNDNIYVYTYKSGKVVQIKNVYGKTGEAAFVSLNCQASGSYSVYKCKKNHLHVIWNGGIDGTEENIYTVSKGKLKKYASANETDISGKHNAKYYSYMINGRKVTGKKYRAFIWKCGTDGEEFVWNTKANRKKYLKS